MSSEIEFSVKKKRYRLIANDETGIYYAEDDDGVVTQFTEVELRKHNVMLSAADIRKKVLDTASSAVLTDRQKTHGEPEDLFTVIAKRWEITIEQRTGIKVNLDAVTIGAMMVDFKQSSFCHNPKHLDNAADGAGYFACAAGCAKAS